MFIKKTIAQQTFIVVNIKRFLQRLFRVIKHYLVSIRNFALWQKMEIRKEMEDFLYDIATFKYNPISKEMESNYIAIRANHLLISVTEMLCTITSE